MAASTFLGMHNPWGTLRRLTAWTLHLTPLPAGMLGLTDHTARIIFIQRGLTQAERRSTLAHELEHVALGPQAPSRWLEDRCDQEAARKLISIRALGEALAWSDDPHEVADELWVDRDLLEARLHHLHPSERAYLKRRLASESG